MLGPELSRLWAQLQASFIDGPRPTDSPVEERSVVAAAPTIVPKYVPLYSYLGHRYAEVVVLTFGEIEDIGGFALPDQARTESKWWTTTDTTGDQAYADAWIQAGRTAVPNLAAQTVMFERGPEG
jgi:hypothetical protein